MHESTHEGPRRPAFPTLRVVPPDAPLRWLSRGWSDLATCPGPSLFYGLCFAAMGYLMVFALRDMPQYIAAVTSGFLLVGPFFAIGLYEISRRHERGERCSLGPTLGAWRANAGNIGVFSLILIVLFLIWARASLVVFALFYTGEMPSLGGFLRHVVSSEHLAFLTAYFAIGAAFAMLAFAIGVISIPLMMDRGHDMITAVIASVIALTRNLPAMTVWAVLIALIASLGLLTFLVGMIVAGPLIGHATWHAYRDLVE